MMLARWYLCEPNYVFVIDDLKELTFELYSKMHTWFETVTHLLHMEGNL